MKKWITFDLDGTLMQNPFEKYVFPEIDEIVSGMKPGCAVVKEMVLENERRMQNNQYPSAYDWDDILNQFLQNNNIAISIDIEKLVRKHSQIPKVYLLEEGIPEVLCELKTRGYSLAVITNGFYKYQYPVMEAIGIVEFFDEIITPDIVKCGKPNVDMAKSLLDAGTIVAHVGDRIDHDVVLANLLGAKSILIDQHLSESLKAFPPEARSFKVAEWKKTTEEVETFLDEALLNDNLFPNIIISSIKEMLLLK